MDIGAEIRKWRRNANMTMAELSRCSGVSKSYIHAIEAGKSNPSFDHVRRIAATFDMSICFVNESRSSTTDGETPLWEIEDGRMR